MKRFFLLVIIGVLVSQNVFAVDFDFTALPDKKPVAKKTTKQTQTRKKWRNDLRFLFGNNLANIVVVNMRTFGAMDINKNGIIEPENGEQRGTFLSGIIPLAELQNSGINTIHLLPITAVGKQKALGTAGSLYALDSFTKLNPQLAEEAVSFSINEQAKYFIDECHRRNIRVIVDLPSCGSYDYSLREPKLFEKDKNGQTIVPADWTDVRLFKVKNADGSLNMDLYNLHKSFVDLMLQLGVDGIRADVASIKPFEFWQKLINYTRTKDPQFLFLAEVSDSWVAPPCKEAVFTPYNKLLEAGFDGYYGSYFKFKNLKKSKDFADIVNFNINLFKNYKENKKAAIGSFMTHDEVNPVYYGGANYAQQLIWLNAVLPVNSYIVDGINTGDAFNYSYANQPADKTETDCPNYYVKNGILDIFNFSKTQGGTNLDLLRNFYLAGKFKASAINFINSANFQTLPSSNPEVFAFSRTDGKDSLVVILNKSTEINEKAKVKVPKLSDSVSVVPIVINSIPKNVHGKFEVELVPSEIQLLYLPGFVVKGKKQN